MSMADFFRSSAKAHESVLARYSDLLLVAGVVAIVALMVLPLPLWLIDLLVAANIASGLMLLLLAIYIQSPLEFSVFPSVLLMSTLFRLSLSIATTRMILLHGEAGHIIDTFGKVVAGGNLVVGLVVFLIITVVQFIVIAKGAERVAEVAARFSLDAMPGKQLSIDSDLRSGLLDKDEAKRKRKALEQESKLHGSLDGAMKFVKGDAIAGIVIIAINLLGGLAVGVMQQGLDIGTAISKYSILTIGEGMVAQVPALLGAMSAGLIVTRSGDDDDKHLGDAIRKQLTAKPRVLLVAGGLCVLMALVPGFPVGAFLALALLGVSAGVLLTPAWRERLQQSRHPAVRGLMRKLQTAPPVTATALPQARPSVPLLLRVPQRLLANEGATRLSRALEQVLNDFQLQLGLSLPRVHLHGAGEDGWELLAFEVPLAQGELPAEDIHHGLAEALRRHAPLFLGIQDTTQLLTRASNDMPDVIKEVLRALPVQRVAEVLRRLVAEGVSIRNLRDILEALSDAAQREKDAHSLAEMARVALKRQISWQVAPTGQLRALMLEPALEELLRQGVRTNSAGSQLALEPAVAQRISQALCAAVRRHQPSAVLTPIDIRWHVRRLVEAECFDTPVLSYHELMPTLQLDVIDRVALPAAPMLEAA
ncbi:flagellar biosynthesis protein FlhA [Azohydromonas caseinilytica]|uniref:Type III secretion protein n=1 Tax=Azohydromonas caseinilytica TaxID=2728836 RepID=A0A848FE70_9BURK|nr:flagellar biosynthesis protein FlhA [Azohydromonas caseinilytica]NML18507.1 type III secretion protein [Azohydromonas caseinilytica]